MSAEPIGSLRVLLGLDSAQFQDGLKKSKNELSSFATRATSAGAAVAAALAGSAALAGVAIKSAVDRADEMGELSEKVGLSVESLSQLEYVGKMTGVGLDALTGSIKKLNVGLVEAAQGGGGKVSEALKQLGISALDANGALKGSDKILSEVAAKFADMPNGVEKSALAVALFGKSGADMIPMLNAGADGIAKLTAEANRLGITISQETSEAAGRFNENLDLMRAVGQGVTLQLAGHMLPAIQGISNAMVGAARNGAALAKVGEAIGVALQALASTAVAAGAAIQLVGYSLFGSFGAALKLMQADVKGAQDVLRWGGQGMVDAATGAAKALGAIWANSGTDFTKKGEKFSNDAAEPFARAGAKIKATGAGAAKEAKSAADKLKDAADRVVYGLMTADEKYAQEFAENRKALVDAMAADIGNREKYLEALERLENERAARGFKAVQSPGRIEVDSNLPQIEEWSTPLDDLIARLEDARDVAYEAAYAVDDIFFGLRNNDWGMAVSGLLRAVKSVRDALAAGGLAGGFTALAGAAQGVGSAIGGKTGGAISGAASGALVGFQFGGPVGAAIGGILGGIGSLFGGSSAKKRARREAEERARQAEAERVARVEAARRELEVRLMELSGDKAGALAKQRQYELDAMDASLHEQQRAVWAAEDLAEAQAKLAAISATRRDLEIQLMEAMGDSAGAIAAQREAYLAGLDESLRPLQSALWEVIDANEALARSQEALAEGRRSVAEAEDRVREAYDREASAYRETIDRFKGIAASLRGYSASIAAAEDGTDSLAAAAARFAKVSAAARLGNEAAMGELQGAGEAYRAAGRSQARTLLEQLRIDAEVRKAAEDAAGTAERHASIAERQLDALTQQLPANLREINLTFAEGIAELNKAMAVEAELQFAANAHLAQLAQSNPFAEIAAMRADLNAGLAEIAKGTGTTADVLQRVTRDGDGMVVAA